jgi:hypothetical protein
MTEISRRGWFRQLLPLLGISFIAILQGCATNPNPYKASEYLILLEQARKIGVLPTLKPVAPLERPVEPQEKETGCDEFF